MCGRMIQGVHASSVLFAGFGEVPGAIARIDAQLPGIGAAGHPIRLQDADFELRLGPARKERGFLVANLHLGVNDGHFRSQMDGLLSFREAPTRSRTNVTFDGRCARGFGGQASGDSTEAVRHVANDVCRTVLQVLVTAIEKSAGAAAASSAAQVPAARSRAKATVARRVTTSK